MKQYIPTSNNCVLFATADWDTPYWTNKQHTADHLVKAGWRVLYVESIGIRPPKLTSGIDGKRLLQRLWRGLKGPRKVREGLWVLSPLVLPFKHHLPLVRAFNQGLLSWTIARFCKRHGMTNPMVWTYHPYVLELIERLRTKHGRQTGPLVYHCVDDLSAIPGIDAKAFRAEEQRLLAVADAVFTTSQTLFSKCSAHSHRVYNFPNVVEFEHFQQATQGGPIPEDLLTIPEPRIGYVGALSDFKVDFALLNDVAAQNPSWQFVLIGEEREGQHDPVLADMAKQPNVHLLGHRPYKELPAYLRGVSVGLLPTRINDYTRSMFPMKYYEYIAAGLPVVSTPLEFTQHHQHGLQMGHDERSFTKAIAEQLRRGRLLPQEVESAVGENTWTRRLKKMMDILQQTNTQLPPHPSKRPPRTEPTQRPMNQEKALLAHYQRREEEARGHAARLQVDGSVKIQTSGIDGNEFLLRALSSDGLPLSFRRKISLAANLLLGRFDRAISRLTADPVADIIKHKRSSNDYNLWVSTYDDKGSAYLKGLLEQALLFGHRPTLSIVMPTYNPNPLYFRKALDSVLAQTYTNWKLCICNDASSQPEAAAIVQEYMSLDDRIRYVGANENGGIASATNQAIGLATGDWVCFLDHDDELPQDALHWVAHTINQEPTARLIYSDEDKIDQAGHRFDPYFKCDFNYELMLAQNMVCHFMAVQKSLLEVVGGLHSEFDGSQDYDLVLRVVERLSPREIVHIPRILYHWRACEGSTAVTTDNKSYALDAARNAVTEHLQRVGVEGEVGPAILPHYNRVKFKLPDPLPLVSIVIPTRDRYELISLCLNRLLKMTSYPNYEVIVVDNGSVDPQVIQFYQTLPSEKVSVIEAKVPFNFSKLVNIGVAHSKGSIVLLLNNDIEVLHEDWLDELVSHAARDGVGAVGAKLLFPDGRVQHSGVICGIGEVAGHSHKFFDKDHPGYFGRAQLHQELSGVTGACLAIKRAVWDTVQGFDEQLSVAFNDVDFCLRVQAAGYRNVWTPHAVLTHHESASRGADDSPEKRQTHQSAVQFMYERWGKPLSDRNYSPNLSRTHEDFSLAWPPTQARPLH